MHCIRTWLIVVLAISALATAEIHRAKQVQKAKPVKSPVLDEHSDDAEFTYDSGISKPGGHSRETWIYSLISATLVGLSGIFPLVVIPLEAGKGLKKGAPAARLKLLLSFAVGGLLGDVFLHLLPEAWMNMDPGDPSGHTKMGLWVLAGILVFLIIEKIFPDAEEEDDDDEEEKSNSSEHDDCHETTLADTQALTEQHQANGTTKAQKRKNKKTKPEATNGYVQNGSVQHNGTANGHAPAEPKSKDMKNPPENSSSRIKTSGWLNLMANIIDNFTHGLAVAGSFCISTKSGVVTTIIILLHEVPHEVGDFAILLRAGFDRWKAAKAQVLTASGGLLGALVALAAESAQEAGNRTAWILPFTSGGFIYVALVTVVPDLLKETCPWESLKQVVTLVSGIGTMAFVAVYVEECDLPNFPASLEWLIS